MDERRGLRQSWQVGRSVSCGRAQRLWEQVELCSNVIVLTAVASIDRAGLLTCPTSLVLSSRCQLSELMHRPMLYHVGGVLSRSL